jgi:hypothetical protein
MDLPAQGSKDQSTARSSEAPHAAHLRPEHLKDRKWSCPMTEDTNGKGLWLMAVILYG